MRKIIALLIIILLSLIFLNVGYGLWSHDTDVAFNLTISPPKDDGSGCCICGTYDTVEEGIALLEGPQYNNIKSKIQKLLEKIEMRTAEFGSMEEGDLDGDVYATERDALRAEVNAMRACVNTYNNCCTDSLAQKYYKIPWNERDDNWFEGKLRQLEDLYRQLESKQDEVEGAMEQYEITGDARRKKG